MDYCRLMVAQQPECSKDRDKNIKCRCKYSKGQVCQTCWNMSRREWHQQKGQHGTTAAAATPSQPRWVTCPRTLRRLNKIIPDIATVICFFFQHSGTPKPLVSPDYGSQDLGFFLGWQPGLILRWRCRNRAPKDEIHTLRQLQTHTWRRALQDWHKQRIAQDNELNQAEYCQYCNHSSGHFLEPSNGAAVAWLTGCNPLIDLGSVSQLEFTSGAVLCPNPTSCAAIFAQLSQLHEPSWWFIIYSGSRLTRLMLLSFLSSFQPDKFVGWNHLCTPHRPWA